MSDYAESKMADVQFTRSVRFRRYTATVESVHGGEMYAPDGLMTLRGDPAHIRLTSGTLKMATEKELCERVCKKQACAIQFCLQRRNYQESKCAEVIKRYYDCCAAAKEAEQKTRTTSS
ncbi:hypothetical protein PC120_g5121 [Phytophthora cactorum]|nr:hypothetical protein PC120_g5121 [Phytophthora cactorum]